MNHQRYLKRAVAFSLFMAAVQVAADKPRSTSPVQPDAKTERLESPEINLRRTRVSRDPVTGQIEIAPGSGMGVRSLSPREQNMLSRSDKGLEPTVLANGAVTVNLRGRFQSMATASSAPGSSLLKMSCSVDAGAASSDNPAPDVH